MRQIFLALFLVIALNSFSQTKAFWTAAWSISSKQDVDKIIENARKYNYNTIYVQTRYRGDALYFPNKKDSTYQNNEQRCYLLANTDFDPLQYFIEQTKNDSIQIHAWVTCFVITPHDLKKINSNHVFYKNKNWITADENQKTMSSQVLEGAYFDPAIDSVQDYTIQIISDIITNYNIDGIQLDYVRYPDSIYGYNKSALSKFKESQFSDFNAFKRQQINSFVNKAFIAVKSIDTNIELSVAVKSNYEQAYSRYSQDWMKWLNKNYVDKVVLMAYDKSDFEFQKKINSYGNNINKEKVVVGVRAWSEKKPYHVNKINSKLKFLTENNFKNIAFYSYYGLISNNYINAIKE